MSSENMHAMVTLIFNQNNLSETNLSNTRKSVSSEISKPREVG